MALISSTENHNSRRRRKLEPSSSKEAEMKRVNEEEFEIIMEGAVQTQVDRDENAILKQQNKEIQQESVMLREALRNLVCTNCNGPQIPADVSMEEDHRLRAENHRLRDEINRASALPQRSMSPPLTNTIINHNSFGKSHFLRLAEKALNELAKLVNVNYPLWIQTSGQGGTGVGVMESLNLKEYVKSCPPCLEIKPDPNSTHYATRASGTVVANSSSILHALMDQNQWVDLFPCIIGKSVTIDIIQTDNRTLQMMYVELQPLSPLVPILRVKFLRFCRQLAEGVWAMVDVSVERCHEVSAFLNCTRFPSGCIVQDMPNGNCSKVTWIEHLVYKEDEISHPLVVGCSSPSFSAQRWLASLQRQYRCLAIVRSPPVSTHHARTSEMISELAKRSMVGMAHRMMRSFGFGLCSTVHQWQLVQAGETRLSVRDNNINNLGEPIGVVLSATNSVWMPVSHQRLFEFLKNKQLRGEWDELDNANPMQELVWISKSNVDELNRVSLLRKTEISNMNQNDVLILQEAQSDASGSMIVYAAVDMPAMKVAMRGGDSSSLEILPSSGLLSFRISNGMKARRNRV
ncbi:homeobox-leucine zipper protein ANTHOCYANINLESS 2-like [Impatiens glandulifera]|uniref:homeobox-leucine zipper protein ANTHOCYANINLESS 2-like n=1 Tax=Impatiens glandulifera TaxID=253017 RepID=UPI001FB0898E|nr:homeobox-leucine zipper protein ANTHOCYANINLESS 2-like [Impatiens glandulifera]